MSNRHPRRPPAGLAGLGDAQDLNTGVNSSRGLAFQQGAPADPTSMVMPALPESMMSPAPSVVSKTDLRKMIEALALPNMKADHVEKLVELIEVVGTDIIQRAFAHYSIFSQVKPFDNYDVYPRPITGLAQAIRLDTTGDDLRNRRALVIFNPSTTDTLWVGKTDRTAVNMGIPIAANNGSYMVAAHERLPHFGYCVTAVTAIVAQYS